MVLRHSVRFAVLGIAWLAIPPLSTTSIAAPRAPLTAIQHPITVRVIALDPVRRGSNVRVRVESTSRTDLQNSEVRLVSAGGASLVGTSRIAMNRLRAGRPAVSEFAVRVPATGHRFLLQFRVTGEGTAGAVSRGATLNLLPDGPADRGREVTIGGETVIEHRARRIER